MATWAHHKELADLDKLRELLSHKGIYIHRPLVIHDRAPDGNRKKCPCGCDSIFAVAVETREHIDLLIDPREGTRVLRQRLDDDGRATFDDLAKEAKRIEMPRRVSRLQLAAMQCTAKVLGVFGGVRGGKTSFGADETADHALMHGGRGVQLWWVAPTLEKTEIGIRKLVEGELIGKGRARRFVEPLFKSELVRYVPGSAKSDRRYIELIDGTRIHLKYAGKDGGNLKGDPPIFVNMDEGCEVDHKENYHQILDRLMEADGRLVIPTTPSAGHWLKAEVYDKGASVEAWDGENIAYTHMTARVNPWVSLANIEKTIATINDPQRVKREIDGEWVGSGPRLWRHFDEQAHVLTSDYRKPSDLGLRDVTTEAVRNFYLGQTVRRHLGQDFNLHPMSSVEIQFAQHPADPKKRTIVIVPEEVVDRVGTIYEHMDSLENRGYANAGLSCDATGAQFNSYRLSHGIKDKNSTQAQEMRRRGFLCQPCRISGTTGEPSNPSQLEKVAPIHRLMMERIDLPDGTSFPRFLVHSRCTKLLTALRTQESDSRGNPVKESNTVADRVSGPSDALCYGVFPTQDFLFPGEGRGVVLE